MVIARSIKCGEVQYSDRTSLQITRQGSALAPVLRGTEVSARRVFRIVSVKPER